MRRGTQSQNCQNGRELIVTSAHPTHFFSLAFDGSQWSSATNVAGNQNKNQVKIRFFTLMLCGDC
jgi:hypothetical protein